MEEGLITIKFNKKKIFYLGKRLSEDCGKKSKIINNLKQQITQLEVVTAARDSAINELQKSHQKIQEQSKELEQMKSKFIFIFFDNK